MNWKRVILALQRSALNMQHHGRELEKPDSYGRYEPEESKARAAACYAAGMMLMSLADAIKEGAE